MRDDLQDSVTKGAEKHQEMGTFMRRIYEREAYCLAFYGAQKYAVQSLLQRANQHVILLCEKTVITTLADNPFWGKEALHEGDSMTTTPCTQLVT